MNNHVISKVAGLLHVTHGEYIGAKMRAKEAAALSLTLVARAYTAGNTSLPAAHPEALHAQTHSAGHDQGIPTHRRLSMTYRSISPPPSPPHWA